MELLITIAYVVLIRLVFWDWKLLRFNAAWGIALAGLWCSAATTEILMLGQYTPYTSDMMVTSYVLPIAPEFGGIVKEVYVEANQPVKAGDPLFAMDPTPWQEKLDELKPQLDIAKRHYRDALALVRANVEREVALEQRRDELSRIQAAVDDAQYKVDHATLVAPEDGYVVNLQLRPGVFIRLKVPVMTFVSTQSLTLVGTVRQRGAQWIREGDPADVALEMYPGKVFPAEVEEVIYASGRAQFTPSGQIPIVEQLKPSEEFAVRLRLKEKDPKHPLRFSASGLAAIYTDRAAGAFVFLRRLEVQSESFLFYFYNPFD